MSRHKHGPASPPKNQRRVAGAVEDWKGGILQAASVRVGCCTDRPFTDLVGIDLCDQNGKPFAHAHFPADVAEELWRTLADAIVQVRADAKLAAASAAIDKL